MNLFFTLILLLFAAMINSVGAQVDAYVVKSAPAITINFPGTVNKREEKVQFICRAGSSTVSNKPLIVIDGVPYEFDELKKLDPNDIASIDLLKESGAAALYRCRGATGVIIVTTKSASIRKFIIKDFLTGEKIPAATIRFTSKKDTINTVADENGSLVIDKLKAVTQYDITISSAGYKTFSTIVKGKQQEILLEKDVKTCGEVIVVGYPGRGCGRICHHSFACAAKSIKIDSIPEVKAINSPDNTFRTLIFPNPVQRNSILNLEFENKLDETIQLAIISMNGSMVSLQSKKITKGLNRLTVTADPRWAAGIYNIQLRNEKGTLVRQEKLVVQ